MTLRAITLAMICTGFGLVAAPLPDNSSSANQSAAVVVSRPFGLAVFKEFLATFAAADAIAIVKFETDLEEATEFETGKKRLLSASGALLPEEGKTNRRIHIQGSFSLVASLKGKIPELGYVKKYVSIDNGGPTDKMYLSLSALLRADENNKSIIVLAMWDKNGAGVLEAKFDGPLAESDAVDVKEFTEALEKEPYATINNNKAEALLVSPNPWLVTVGLVRLEQLQELSLTHFVRAIISSPSTVTERFADDMIRFANRLDNWAGLTKEVGELIPLIEPTKQIRVLLRIEGFLTLNPDQERDAVQVAEFQRVLGAYRQEIANDPERREVRERIDALLSVGQKK